MTAKTDTPPLQESAPPREEKPPRPRRSGCRKFSTALGVGLIAGLLAAALLIWYVNQGFG